MSWAKDPKTGKELWFSKPFQSREEAVKFALTNGLGKRAVRSRPAGYVVERDVVNEDKLNKIADSLRRVADGVDRVERRLPRADAIEPSSFSIGDKVEDKEYPKSLSGEIVKFNGKKYLVTWKSGAQSWVSPKTIRKSK